MQIRSRGSVGSRDSAFRLLVALLMIFAVASAAEAQSPRTDTIVKLARAPRFAGGGTLTPDLTIGTTNGAPEYTFAGISSVLAAKDGSVWVLEAASPAGNRLPPRLRQYDANGVFLRNVGRFGEGPGEFSRRPNGLAQLPDGRVLMRDIMAKRVLVYTADGRSLATWTFGPNRYDWTAGGPAAIVADTAGTVYMPIRLPPPPNETVATREGRALLRLRSDGRVIDTIQAPDLPAVALPRFGIQHRDESGNPGGQSFGVPYSAATSWYWSPLGHIVTAVTNRYAIDIRVPRASATAPATWRPGDPVISIRRDIAPVPVSEVERSEYREYLAASLVWVEREEARKGRTTTREGTMPEVPRIKPYFTNMTFGEDGRLWVYVSMPSVIKSAPAPMAAFGLPEPRGKWVEPRAVDAFEPDGAYLGRVPLPDDFVIRSTRGDIVWGVVRDADGVESLKRFRVVWK